MTPNLEPSVICTAPDRCRAEVRLRKYNAKLKQRIAELEGKCYGASAELLRQLTVKTEVISQYGAELRKSKARIAELESLCHTQVLYIRAVEAAIHDDMQDSEAGPYSAEHWAGCVTHYPYNPDAVLDVPDYDTIVNKLKVRVAELEAGLQLAQATCAVYSEKVDMLESQLAAQESAHDPQP